MAGNSSNPVEPALTPARHGWTSLRPAPTPFLGREPEIRLATSLLHNPDVRLLTLTGPGGIGKTRLALRVADELDGEFRDGVTVLSLASTRDPALVLPSLVEALQIPESPGTPLDVRLRAFLADQSHLIVLDNLEHLLAIAPDLADLLASAPGLTLLLTSRSPLGIAAEHVLTVSPLSTDEARQLFVERVRAVDPGFAPGADLEPIVDAICERLDRLPLAIELAAARARMLPPRALLARLERRLDLLRDGPRDAPERLRDMRGAIAWSHDLLSDPEQTLFRRLGVFIGGFTLEAAQAVAGTDDDIFSDLGALVSASLVQPAPDGGDEPRFLMLETIREYALEQLAAHGETAEYRTRHARTFQALAEEALPHLDTAEMWPWALRVAREVDNHRAAMAWALEHDEVEIGTRLAGALWRMWSGNLVAGRKVWVETTTEGRDWCVRMLARWPDQPAPVLCEALVGAAFLSAMLGDADRARWAATTLLARSTTEDYPYGAWWAHYILGEMAMGFLHHSMTGLHQVELDAERLDTDLPARRGRLMMAEPDLAVARRHFEAALAIAPTIRNPDNHTAMSLELLATWAWRSGDLQEAEERFEQAVARSRSTGNPWVLAMILAACGGLLHAMDQPRRAARRLAEAVDRAPSLTDSPVVGVSLMRLADIAFAWGEADLAARLLGRAGVAFASVRHFTLHDQIATRARSALREPRFDQELQRGTHLTRNELREQIAALEAMLDAAPVRPGPAHSHGLTARERDVLRLLAQGRSNRAIADTFSLSERTVENHVFRILTKLNLESRAAAAAWAVRHGLD